jgi:hypothetical protein
VFASLEDWKGAVQNFHGIYQTARGMYRHYDVNTETRMVAEDASNDPNSPAIPGRIDGAESTVISGVQHLFQSGLQSLIRVRGHQYGKNFNKIMYNVEVLVFCLWWFRMVGA